MPRYAEFPLKDGGSVFLEVDDQEPVNLESTGVRKAARMRSSDVSGVVRQTFEESIDNVGGAADLLLERLRALSPDEVEVTFGLKASGELGNFVIAKLAAEANYTVRVKWSREKGKTWQGSAPSSTSRRDE